MDRNKEAELFDHLCRYTRVREWFEEQLGTQIKVLTVNPDIEQLRKAQGAAQFINVVLDKLKAAESAAKR